MNHLYNIKIISGGQTGVDRAALDFAINNGMPCGGWCPKGRLAEDGKLPLKYPLKETKTSNYPERTEKNILESDGTLIIYSDKFDRGTALTKNLCNKHKKACLIHKIEQAFEKDEFLLWIKKYRIKTLNVAGPRESISKGIYMKTLQFFEMIFKPVEKRG